MPHRKPITDAQTERARSLRHDAPFPQALLWSRLRGRRLAGIKFRREFPVDSFYVDFFCDDAMLGIELDGDSHKERAEYDAARTTILEAAGLHIIRVGNDDVLTDLDGVLEMILRECKRRMKAE